MITYSNNTFTQFLTNNELSLSFEFSYNGICDNSIILGISAVNDETPSITDLTNFLDEVGKDKYDVVVDYNTLAVYCDDKRTARNIISAQADVIRRTSVLRSDEDLTDLIDNLRYHEMMIREIHDA